MPSGIVNSKSEKQYGTKSNKFDIFEFVPSKTSEDQGSTSMENGDNPNILSELEKVLKMIITGLSSPNDTTRTECYVLLTTLLYNYKNITFGQINSYIQSSLEPSRTLTDTKIIYFNKYVLQEDPNVLMGQLLTYGSLVRSGAFFRYDEHQQIEIIEKILLYRKKEKHLSLAASIFFTDIIEKVDESTFVKIVWPVFQSEIVLPWTNQTVDTLYLLCLAKRKFPKVLDGSTLLKKINCTEIFTCDNVKHLCNILLDVLSKNQLKHPVYIVVSMEIANCSILPYFSQHMDYYLQELDRNKFSVALIIITNTIRLLDDPNIIPDLLQYNFMLQLQQYCKDSYTYRELPDVYEKINEFFETLQKTLKLVQVSDKNRVECLKKLLIYPGDLSIDNKSNVKVIQGIISTLNAEGVKELAIMFKNIITESFVRKNRKYINLKWNYDEKILAFEYFSQLLKHPKVRNESEWIVDQLKFLFHYGFVLDNSTLTIDSNLADHLQEIFFETFNLKFPKLRQLYITSSAIFKYLDSFLTRKDCGTILRTKHSKEALFLWQKSSDFMNTLEGQNNSVYKPPVDELLHTLFRLMPLNLLAEELPAIASIQELFLTYQSIKEKNEKKSNWIDEIIIFILKLLTYDSGYIRKTIFCLTSYLNPYMTYGTIRNLLSILDPQYEKSTKTSCFLTDDCYDNDYERFCNSENVIIRDAIKGKELLKFRTQSYQIFTILRNRANTTESPDILEKAIGLKEQIIEILKIYINKEPSLKPILDIMVSLLDAMEYSLKDNQHLFNKRLKSCFQSLISLKKFSSFDGLSSTDLANLLRVLLENASELSSQKKSLEEISKACTFIVKCSSIINLSKKAPQETKKKLNQKFVRILTMHLEQFFKNKNMNNMMQIFKSIMEKKWTAIHFFVPCLYVHVFKQEIKLFKRGQALELLTAFYKNHDLLEAEKNKIQKVIHDDELLFSNNLINFFQVLCKNPDLYRVKERYITNIFQTLTAILSSPLEDKHFDWENIISFIKQYRGNSMLSRDAKSAYNKLMQLFDLVKKGEEVNSGKDKLIDKYQRNLVLESNVKNHDKITMDDLMNTLCKSSKQFTKNIFIRQNWNDKNDNQAKESFTLEEQKIKQGIKHPENELQNDDATHTKPDQNNAENVTNNDDKDNENVSTVVNVTSEDENNVINNDKNKDTAEKNAPENINNDCNITDIGKDCIVCNNELKEKESASKNSIKTSGIIPKVKSKPSKKLQNNSNSKIDTRKISTNSSSTVNKKILKTKNSEEDSKKKELLKESRHSKLEKVPSIQDKQNTCKSHENINKNSSSTNYTKNSDLKLKETEESAKVKSKNENLIVENKPSDLVSDKKPNKKDLQRKKGNITLAKSIEKVKKTNILRTRNRSKITAIIEDGSGKTIKQGHKDKIKTTASEISENCENPPASIIPATSTVIPVTSTVIPTTSTVIPTSSTVIPATLTQEIISGSQGKTNLNKEIKISQSLQGGSISRKNLTNLSRNKGSSYARKAEKSEDNLGNTPTKENIRKSKKLSNFSNFKSQAQLLLHNVKKSSSLNEKDHLKEASAVTLQAKKVHDESKHSLQSGSKNNIKSVKTKNIVKSNP